MLKNILIFVAGFAVGGFAGYKFACAAMKKASDLEVEEMRDYYRSLREYREKLFGEQEEEIQETEEKETIEEGGFDYGAIYRESYGEYEDASSDDEESEETIEERANREHEEERDLPPRVISDEEIGELSPRFETQTLFYYTEDDAIVDEGDEEILDYMRFLGNTLEDIGFFDDPEQTITLVVNYEYDVLYEVQKIFGTHAT